MQHGTIRDDIGRMTHQATARPVSGEIMAAAAGQRRDAPAIDVVDADYEEVARPAGPAFAAAAEPAAPDVSALGGMEMLRKAARTAQREPARGGPLFWAGGIGIALAAFWISGGHALVRGSGFFAGAQAAKTAFSITGVNSRFDASGPRQVLMVDGEAANEGSEAGVLPPLEIRVAAPNGSVTRYTLGTSGRLLGPGQRFAFSSRLDVPKNGVGTVTVAFAE